MSNLVNISGKKEIVFCPSLSSAESQIVISSRTNRVFKLTDESLKSNLITSIINAASIIGNKSLGKEDIKLMTNQLFDYVRMNNKYSYIGEILLAIKFGSYGKYLRDKDVLFISVSNIAKWIKSYEDEKRDVLSKQSKFEKEVIDSEIEKNKFMEAKEKYWIDLPKNIANCKGDPDKNNKMASIYFENLWKLGVLKLDKEEIEIATREARQSLREQRKNLIQIGKDNIEKMANKIAKEKAFYLWIEENRENNIEKIVEDAIINKL